jgi:hypothetical protein
MRPLLSLVCINLLVIAMIPDAFAFRGGGGGGFRAGGGGAAFRGGGGAAFRGGGGARSAAAVAQRSAAAPIMEAPSLMAIVEVTAAAIVEVITAAAIAEVTAAPITAAGDSSPVQPSDLSSALRRQAPIIRMAPRPIAAITPIHPVRACDEVISSSFGPLVRCRPQGESNEGREVLSAELPAARRSVSAQSAESAFRRGLFRACGSHSIVQGQTGRCA